jgi:hypothetical protein
MQPPQREAKPHDDFEVRGFLWLPIGSELIIAPACAVLRLFFFFLCMLFFFRPPVCRRLFHHRVAWRDLPEASQGVA